MPVHDASPVSFAALANSRERLPHLTLVDGPLTPFDRRLDSIGQQSIMSGAVNRSELATARRAEEGRSRLSGGGSLGSMRPAALPVRGGIFHDMVIACRPGIQARRSPHRQSRGQSSSDIWKGYGARTLSWLGQERAGMCCATIPTGIGPRADHLGPLCARIRPVRPFAARSPTTHEATSPTATHMQ